MIKKSKLFILIIIGIFMLVALIFGEYFIRIDNIVLKNNNRSINANNKYIKTIGKEENTIIFNVPFFSQEKYPTGCELVSTSMLLAFYGFEISAGELIENGYVKTREIYELDGTIYGGHPNQYFIGSPYDKNSFGCYSGVIKTALERFLEKEEFEVKDISGMSIEEMCHEYIDNGNPVLLWASINMDATYKKDVNTWIIDETMEEFQWISNEHCLVLVGYDEKKYWFNDPLKDSSPIAYEKEITEQRYSELGKQAITIYPRV